jgi:hypothetical protein
MQHGVGADNLWATLEKVRAAVPGIALSASFIVCFPAESLRGFESLEQFSGEPRFDWLSISLFTLTQFPLTMVQCAFNAALSSKPLHPWGLLQPCTTSWPRLQRLPLPSMCI